MSFNQFGNSAVVTDFAPENSTSTTRNSASVPSVAMIDGTPPYATNHPLTAPRMIPITSAISTATSGCIALSRVSIVPTMYADIPTIDETDKSMFRVSTTNT